LAQLQVIKPSQLAPSQSKSDVQEIVPQLHLQVRWMTPEGGWTTTGIEKTLFNERSGIR